MHIIQCTNQFKRHTGTTQPVKWICFIIPLWVQHNICSRHLLLHLMMVGNNYRHTKFLCIIHFLIRRNSIIAGNKKIPSACERLIYNTTIQSVSFFHTVRRKNFRIQSNPLKSLPQNISGKNSVTVKIRSNCHLTPLLSRLYNLLHRLIHAFHRKRIMQVI